MQQRDSRERLSGQIEVLCDQQQALDELIGSVLGAGNSASSSYAKRKPLSRLPKEQLGAEFSCDTGPRIERVTWSRAGGTKTRGHGECLRRRQSKSRKERL